MRELQIGDSIGIKAKGSDFNWGDPSYHNYTEDVVFEVTDLNNPYVTIKLPSPFKERHGEYYKWIDKASQKYWKIYPRQKVRCRVCQTIITNSAS